MKKKKVAKNNGEPSITNGKDYQSLNGKTLSKLMGGTQAQSSGDASGIFCSTPTTDRLCGSGCGSQGGW